MHIKLFARKASELGLALLGISISLLAGCGAGSNNPQPVCCAMPNIDISVVPYKGVYASGAVVTLEDAYGLPVSLTSSGTVNASGVADIKMIAFPNYPLVVNVSGSYYNENSGVLEPSGVPLRGLITSYEALVAASSVPVTAVTETAVADLLNRSGSTSAPGYQLQSASAVASLKLAGDMLGIPASAVPAFDANTRKTNDANTLRLSALAIAANNKFAGATLAHRVQALGASLATLNAASAPSEIITQAEYNAAFNAMTGGASSVMAAGTTLPASPVVSVSTQATLYASALDAALSPTVTSVTASTINGNAAMLTVNATDDTAVTSYCFKTANSAPLAGDACFQASAQKNVSLAFPAMQYVWAKDASGNVSGMFRGPCSSAGYAASDLSSKNTVCMMTSKGEVVLELDAGKAPVTVANFLQYVNEGFYNGTTFHRVISNFMIQGGGYTVSGTTYQPKTATHPSIALERTSVTGLSNTRGTIAMARTSQPDTATSQFFINVVDNLFLNVSGADPNGYAAFGSVISGMAVVDQIKVVPVVSNGAELSLPSTPVYVLWAYQIK